MLLEGGVAGGEPPRTREGRRPDRPELQGIGAGGQGLVVRDGASSASELMADWPWFRRFQRIARGHPRFGLQPRKDIV